MSATETPPPEEQQQPQPEPDQRRCPRCAAPLTPQQDWCLACGADVGARIVSAPSWRGPLALVVGLLAVAALALILLADERQRVAESRHQRFDARFRFAALHPQPVDFALHILEPPQRLLQNQLGAPFGFTHDAR